MTIKEEHPILETVDIEVYAGSPFDLNEISSWNIISELLKGTISKKDISIEVDNLPICDTFWTDERFAHNSSNGQYSDSIIVNQYGKSSIIEDITFNLILRDSHEVITGHCSGSLRFETEHLS